MHSFDFEEDLNREGRSIFSKEWTSLQSRVHSLRDFNFVGDGNNPHRDIVLFFDDYNSYVENKLDRYPYSGNIIIEMLASVSLNELPLGMYGKSRSLRVGEDEHSRLSAYLETGYLSGNSKAKPGLGFLTDSDIDSTHLFHTIFIDSKQGNKIVKQVIFRSLEISNFVRSNYVNFDYVITKSHKNGRYWATVSNRIPLEILRSHVPSIYVEGSFTASR